MQRLSLHTPDPDRFAPYGRLWPLDAPGAGRPINDGTTRRLDLPAGLDLQRAGGSPVLAVFHAQAQALDTPRRLLERHRLGSQSFVPLAPARWVVLVARGEDRPDPATLAAFALDGGWGLTLAPGTWHHALVALEAAPFLVLERAGPGGAEDCELAHLAVPVVLAPAP